MKDYLSANPIWVIEDNPDDEEMTLRELSRSGVANRIECFRDGEQALQKLGEVGADEVPTLILLDMHLPKVSGFELLQQIRKGEKTQDASVVVMISSEEDKQILEAMGVEGTSFALKPLRLDQLFKEIRALKMKWLLL